MLASRYLLPISRGAAVCTTTEPPAALSATSEKWRSSELLYRYGQRFRAVNACAEQTRQKGSAVDIVTVIIVLILAGAAVYIANLLPIDGTMKTIIKVVVIVALVIWLLQGFAPSLKLG